MSLRRLGMDRIALLYLHRVDPDVPFADQIGTMKELRDEGKIVQVGLSEVAVEQIEAARAVVDVAAVQNIHNLTTRTWDDVLTYCTRERIPLVAWFPVVNGALARTSRLPPDCGSRTGEGQVDGLSPRPLDLRI